MPQSKNKTQMELKMALSNWDTLAFGPDGNCCTGGLNHRKTKNSLTIYKNWVYVESEEMWRESGLYRSPIIAKIKSGSIEIAGFHIEAARGPQDAIFIYAYYDDKDEKRYYCFAGIGCYGYKGAEWIGVLPSTVADFFLWLRKVERDNFDDPELINWIAKCQASKILRYNQGDSFFAEVLGRDIPTTEPGKSQEPFLLDLLRAANED